MSKPFLPSLPQAETQPKKRSRSLIKARRRYRYASSTENAIAPVAIAEPMPMGEGFGLDWALPYLPQLGRSVRGVLAGHLRFSLTAKSKRNVREILGSLFDWGPRERPPLATAPEVSDEELARSWLDGPNPLVLERVESCDQLRGFGTTDRADLERSLEGALSLEDEIARGRIYRVDYNLLRLSLLNDKAKGRDSRWREKYLPAPLVLLHERKRGDALCALTPIAIRIDQDEAEGHNPIYWQHGDSAAWRLAKIYVLVADFNLQTLCSHIYRHHFFMEPIALTTKRQLASNHPLRVLLDPHIAYTNALNRAAFELLEQPGSVFDQIYGGRLIETQKLMRVAKDRFTVEAAELETDLAARKVSSEPKDYPWRNDARSWNAIIERFVQGYVSHYYRTDLEVRRDGELRGWLDELSDEEGGALRGLPTSNAIGRESLIRLLTQLLFTAGPGHAAVHYPQTDYFSFASNYPGAAYLPPPRRGEVIDERRINDTLPPFARGAAQFLSNQIAYYRFDRFGDYRKHRLGSISEVGPIVNALRVDLLELEVTIERRNAERPRPYRYLLPSLVPNSVNI